MAHSAPIAANINLTGRSSGFQEGFDHGFFRAAYRDRFATLDLEDFDVALAAYLRLVSTEQLDPNPAFSESRYLAAYPDVQAAVNTGLLLSGFQHWMLYGREEARPIFRAESPAKPQIDPPYENPDFAMMFDLFDAHYFRERHQIELNMHPAADARRLFDLYLLNAAETPLDPNAHFSESHYFARNPDVQAAVRSGSYLCGFHHWVMHGRLENRVHGKREIIGAAAPQSLPAAEAHRFRAMFQYDVYAQRKGFAAGEIAADAAFEAFIAKDLMAGLVPVDRSVFDEDFYLLYYADVRAAKQQQRIPSGYYHYVLAGRAENRQPVYNMGRLLGAKLGDAAEAVGLHRVDDIGNRVRPVPFRISRSRKVTMNVFIPSLDGDIMFGGYLAFMNFLVRLAEDGHSLRLIIMEDPYGSREWFFRFLAGKPRWRDALTGQEIVNATAKDKQLACNADDICIAYSCWTANDAWSVAQHLRKKSIVFFIQEYEPIFHENDALQFVMASFYKIPHLAVFNSELLMQYFKSHGLGVFSAAEPAPFLCLKHALADVRPAAILVPAAAQKRKLICYARPEKHAGRNLFEICILALRQAIEQEVFQGDWEFFGIGSLGRDYEVTLSPRHSLKIVSRVPQADYESLLQSFDVGLSLMWAPHPSVIPFELAKAGVVTVTNTYELRNAEVLAGFGHNVVPAAADLPGIVAGLREAVRRAADGKARIEGAKFDWPVNWDAVFHKPFFRALFQQLDIEN